MDWRNRIGIYGAYLLGMAGIGFTLPYLPLFLRQHGMSDRAIGVASTVAALAGLAQFPIGVWSDRIGRRKPFLVVALAILAVATWLLRDVESVLWLGLLVVLFAENGLCRASAESLFGAEVAQLAPPGKVGAALGALRFWKPVTEGDLSPFDVGIKLNDMPMSFLDYRKPRDAFKALDGKKPE